MDHSSTFVFIAIFGGLMLVGTIAMIGGFMHARRERMLTHAERMKALELGREWPDVPVTAEVKAKNEVSTSPPKPLAVRCYSTTGWVAGLGLLFAMQASGPASNAGVAYAIAASAGAIGVTGLICGTILAAKHSESQSASSSAATNFSKPRFDPEAV